LRGWKLDSFSPHISEHKKIIKEKVKKVKKIKKEKNHKRKVFLKICCGGK
jgi:hypothetical protein